MSRWWVRHLNLSLLIAWLGSTAVLGMVATFVPEHVLSSLWWLALVIWIGRFIVCASVTSWVLEKKGRGTGIVWLFLVGLGLVAIIYALASSEKEPAPTPLQDN